VSWYGESIDLTTGEDNCKRVLEALSAQEQIDISAEGLMKEEQI